MQILFFGLENCEYTKQAISTLDQTNHTVTICLVANRKSQLPKDIATWQGDLILSFKNYIKLPVELLKNAKIASINFHPALPKYPGSGGLAWSIYHNEEYHGVTIHLMNERIDAGKILEVNKLPIGEDDDLDSLTKISNEMHLNTFNIFVKSKLQEQSHLKLENYIVNNDCNSTWSQKTHQLHELTKLKVVDNSINEQELTRRVRAFHLPNFPLQMRHHNFLFNLVRED